jgi:hypothetical protein
MDISLIDIFWYALAAWVSIKILQALTNAYIITNIESRIEHLKYLNSIIHEVKTEQQGDMEYWYDKESEEFLGQGKSIDEIANVLKARFPEHVFILGERGGLGRNTDWKLMTPAEFKSKASNIL